MNLQQLRDFIRAQLDVDDEELPNPMVDAYLQDSFTATIASQPTWPFYETRWDISNTAPDGHMPLPADCNPAGIMSIIDLTSGYRLVQVGQEMAEDSFYPYGVQGTSAYYTIFANGIELWPNPTTDVRVYRMRGHRYPRDWIGQGASSEVDADPRLHQLLAWHAIALTYAAEEDEVLEATYMQRWSQSLAIATRAILAPRHHRPLVLNLGLPYNHTNGVVWNLPA